MSARHRGTSSLPPPPILPPAAAAVNAEPTKHYGLRVAVCQPACRNADRVLEAARRMSAVLVADAARRDAGPGANSLDRRSVEVSDRRRRGRQTVREFG